jgi:hypothetical protein
MSSVSLVSPPIHLRAWLNSSPSPVEAQQSRLSGVLDHYAPARGFQAGVRRSDGSSAAGAAAGGRERGGGAGGVPGRGSGGARWRAAGPVHALGRPAARRACPVRSCPIRGASPGPRRPRPVPARSAGGPFAVCFAIRDALAAATPFSFAEQLALIAGTHQPGRPYTARTKQVAQPAQDHSWPVSGRPPCRCPRSSGARGMVESMAGTRAQSEQ